MWLLHHYVEISRRWDGDCGYKQIIYTFNHLNQYWSTLTNILSSTSFTDQIVDERRNNIHATIIVRTDVNKNWPKFLRYGNRNIGTLNWKHFRTEQLIWKFDTIHRFLILSDYSTLALILIDNYQLVAGIAPPILKKIHSNTSYVTST